ncbi:hypothetical protein VaNZ11_005094 [Volvox africanus]|uniref:J domain-containing protein n=1 Tax=Volvox africanus TaxID=51714 RepID=A0ABQ5RXW3_9CHLO|nr:hypothetical protein VaNZ11_005094 [Volvox africanus]
MKSSSEIHTSIAVPLQTGTSASFVLGLGTDGPSPSRKPAGRARSSSSSSKIPQRPTGGVTSSATHAASDEVYVPKTSASNPAPSVTEQPAGTEAISHQPFGLPQSTVPMNSGTAAAGPAAEGAFPVPRVGHGPPGAPGSSQLAVPIPIFTVGPSDGQTVGMRTPRGGRMRTGKAKTSAAASPLRTPPPPAPVAGSTALPFSTLGLDSLASMTPIDDHTYQKLAQNTSSWAVSSESPMDITPQGSTISSSSNVFVYSPLVGGPCGRPAVANGGAESAPGDGAGMASSASSAPMPFPGFASAVPVTAPVGAAAGGGGGSAAAASFAATGPVAPAAPAPVHTAPAAPPGIIGGTSTSGNLRFPIQIQIPGAREVQDMFTSVASASASGGPAAGGSGNSNRGGDAGSGAPSASTGLHPNGTTGQHASVGGPAGAASTRQQGQQHQSIRTAAAVLTAAAKKLPDEHTSTMAQGGPATKRGHLGVAKGGAVGNDCQPTKDNASKASRVTIDNGGATTAGGNRGPNTAVPFSTVGGSVAAAPKTAAASRASGVATAAAALGLAAAGAVAVASSPAGTTGSEPDILVAVAEQLEHMAQRTREAAAAAAAARGASGDGNAAAAVEAVIATLANESNPAIRPVLEIMLRPGAMDAKVAAAVAAARESAQEAAAAPGLAAAVACMLGALKLDDSQLGTQSQGFADDDGSTPRPAAAAGGGGGSGSRGSSAGGIPSVPFVFGCASSGGGSSQGGASAPPAPAAPSVSPAYQSTTASASAPVGAAPTVPSRAAAATTNQVPTQQPMSVPFMFGVPGSSCQNGTQSLADSKAAARVASSAPLAFGSTTGTAFGSAAGVATAAAAAFGTAAAGPSTAAAAGVPTHQAAPQQAFLFGASASGPGAPQPSARQAHQSGGPTHSGESANMSTGIGNAPDSASLMSTSSSPMSTTPPAAAQHSAQFPTAVLSPTSGWAGAASAAAMGAASGGEAGFTFTVGDASAPMANGGVTPGRIGGRVRPKITPRKTRATAPMDTSQPAGFAGLAAALPPAAAAPSSAAPMPSTAAAAAANGVSMAQPQPAAAAAAGHAERHAGAAAAKAATALPQASRLQSSAGAVETGLDAMAVEAVRLKRDADEKKQYGNQKYELSDFRSAERWYSEAIELLENKLQQLGLAREKVQQLFPNLKTEIAVLYSNRSGARLMTAKPQSALADALRALDVDPRFMRAASRAATCHCRLGDFAAAHRIIDAAMDRCSASSSHYQDMLKKLNEVVDLGSRARAATAAAVSAVSSGTREKLQEAADQLAVIRDMVGYCDVVAAARAVLALRLGFPREVLVLLAPHPEAAPQQRSAPWRLWLVLQAHYYKGDLQEAMTTCRELQLSLETVGPESGTAAEATGSGSQEQGDGGAAAAAAYTTSAHVTVPPAAVLTELVESFQQMLKLKEDGNNAIKQNRLPEAAESYTRALGLGCCPAYAAVLHANRAAAHAGQGAVADAVADCGRARALDPSYYKASSRLASYMLELRRPDEALGMLDPLVKLTQHSDGLGPRPDEMNTIKERLMEARSLAVWQKTPQHYKLLGLTSNCSEEDVRKAYRRLALKHHPDKALAAIKVSMALPGRAGGAPYSWPMLGTTELEARVREEASWLFSFINQAHEELSDKTRRRKVDQLLDAEQPSQSGRYGAGAASNPYGNGWYNSGSGRYSSFSNFYGVDPFFFHRPAGSGPTGGGGGAGGPGGSSRSRAATGGGAGYGTYGSYTGGSRPSSARQAGANGTNSNGPARNNTAGASRGNGNGAGGAAAGAAAGGGGYGGGYARAGGGGGPGARSANGGRKWWEGGNDFSDDDEEDTFNF